MLQRNTELLPDIADRNQIHHKFKMSVFTVSVMAFALYGRSNRDHKLQFKSCDTFNHRKVSHL